MKTILIVFTLCLYAISYTMSQPWDLNGNSVTALNYLGTTNAQPLHLQTLLSQNINFSTFAVQRMIIRGSNNSPYATLSNVGYVGINTNAPASPLHVRGDLTQPIIPGAGWANGIMISNRGALVFEGDRANVPANRDYFIAHPSLIPQGDVWHGLVPGIDGLGLQYVYQLYGQPQLFGSPIPQQGTHYFLTTVLADIRVGLNTLVLSQRIETVNTGSQQLRITQLQIVT